MNRKQFTGSLAALLASTLAGASPVGAASPNPQEEGKFRHPEFLYIGDIIGITTPAGPIELAGIQPAKKILESWGFKIHIGQTVGKKQFTFGGTDEERRQDFQALLDDENVKAILCGRGGYGIVRIIDQLDFTRFMKHPKWIIGFSDITILHQHLQHRFHMASIHSKMCNSFPDDWTTADYIQQNSIISLQNALIGKKLEYHLPANPANRNGIASGILVGGNLRIIESLIGTSGGLDTKGKILFLEDADEYLYNIDRMFWHLKAAGKLSQLKGLVIGGFKIKPDDPGDEFGLSLEQIIAEKTAAYSYPVCYGLPVGHQKNNFAVRCGMPCQLEVNESGAFLIQAGWKEIQQQPL